jgi:hypothetical protein
MTVCSKIYHQFNEGIIPMTDEIKKKVDDSWKDKAKTEPLDNEQDAAGAPPEPDFKFFVTTLAMQAWIALGVIPNPVTQKTEENFGQAKYIIDTLEIIEKKTKGNLDKEEKELMDGLLHELHMGFVHKTTGKPPAPGNPQVSL